MRFRGNHRRNTRKEAVTMKKKQIKHQQVKKVVSEMKISLDVVHSKSDPAEIGITHHEAEKKVNKAKNL